MVKKKPALLIGLLLLALGTVSASATEVLYDPGAPGSPANNGEIILNGVTGLLEIKFTDKKTLEYGPDSPLSFAIQTVNTAGTPYEGYFTDAQGQKIEGTDFAGATELGATQLWLPGETVWSGMTLNGAWGDLENAALNIPSVYGLIWITAPLVGQGSDSGNQTPIAEAGGPYSGVVGVEVDFIGTDSSDQDGNITDYTWEFGDGNMAVGETVSYAYEVDGTYNVTLTVTDDSGSSDSDTASTDIGLPSEPPQADAGGPYEGTMGATVTFDGTGSSDADGEIVSYDWVFGDGETGSGATPTHIYEEAGDYTVELTVTDDTSIASTDFTEALVGTGNQPPSANAGAPVAGVVGQEVTFNGNASYDPDGEITQYDWDYGDDTSDIDAGPTPSHVYDGVDIYTVTLTVTDDNGSADSTFTTADIAESNIRPTANANGPYTATLGVAVNFDSTGSSDSDGEILALVWNFGDGNSAVGDSPSHTYSEQGSYEVLLTVIDNDGGTDTDRTSATIDVDNQPPVADANGPYAGSVDVPVTFDGTASVDPDGDNLALFWDFGDGGTGVGPEPQHTYFRKGTYDVILTAIDLGGAKDESLTEAVIGEGNVPPVADAGGPYRGGVDTAIFFDGTGSYDPDGSIATYEWNFGDGNAGNGSEPSHTYNAAGIYNVTLTVTDNNGPQTSDKTVAVVGSLSEPPTADAGGPYSGTVGEPVGFDGRGSSDSDSTIATYEWNFGDGGSGTGVTPKHTYNAPDEYTVTLTVTDRGGDTDTDTTTATVGSGNLPPTADAGGPYIGSAGVPKTFDGTSSFDPDGDTLTYAWNFGDGTTGVGPTPTTTYNEPGSYTVSVTVTDEIGSVDSSSTTAVIGESNPDPDDRRIDLATITDVNQNRNVDLALLNVGMANGDQVSAEIHVHDGRTGEEIYRVSLPEIWRSLALDSAVGVSGEMLAVLQRNDDGDIRVNFRRAVDGSDAGDIQYFDNTWTPIGLLTVSDAGGDGVAGVGVLAENPAGQQAIEVYLVSTGDFVNQVLFFNNIWKASHAVDLGEFNGNGVSELAVLATNNAGKHAVETRDTLSGKQISRHFFLGPTNTMKGLAQSADVDGNGKPELIVLGNKDAANNTAQAKDVKTGALVSKPGSFAPPFVGFALRSMGDVDGNTSPEMVIGAFDDGNDITRVQVRDVLNGTLTLNTGILSAAFDPRDLEILEDVSGNGIQELVAAGLNRDTLAIRVQTRDGQTGALLLNIDVN
jgi:PKD repeat protein